jgi:hypothetical protein
MDHFVSMSGKRFFSRLLEGVLGVSPWSDSKATPNPQSIEIILE